MSLGKILEVFKLLFLSLLGLAIPIGMVMSMFLLLKACAGLEKPPDNPGREKALMHKYLYGY